jgi:hypothetical protein
MIQNKKTQGALFLGIMTIFALGSSDPGPKKQEVLAKKFGVSETEAASCLSIFEKDTEAILDWISRQKGFLGFGKKDCGDLRKEIADYGSVENLLYGLQNNLKPTDTELKNYVVEQDRKKIAEEARNKAEDEAKKKAEEDKKIADQEALAKEYDENKLNASWLDKKYGVEGAIRCGSGSDDYARKAAKNSFKWEEMSWYESKFTSYLTKVNSEGVVTYTSDKLLFQNGFGAYVRVEMHCNYDTQAKKVIGYEVLSN